MSPFDFVNSISETKQVIMKDDLDEKAYNAFMVNRALSQFPDTVLLANEMNRHHHLDNKLQYNFLLHTVRKSKRRGKWAKESLPEDIEIVKEYYGYSNEKAKSALSLLSKDQIEEMKKKLFKGGASRR